MIRLFGLSLCAALYLSACSALAQQTTIEISIKNHRFEPSEINVPAGEAVTLRVKNLDATPEEFESKALRIEKIIPGKSEGIIQLRAMQRGRYAFSGEFNEATAQGVVVVK